jgi:hypothetical protein
MKFIKYALLTYPQLQIYKKPNIKGNAKYCRIAAKIYEISPNKKWAEISHL